jgi:hypothetical protein
MEPLQAHCQRGLGRVARRQGRTRRGDHLLAAADRLYRRLGMVRWL